MGGLDRMCSRQDLALVVVNAAMIIYVTPFNDYQIGSKDAAKWTSLISF